MSEELEPTKPLDLELSEEDGTLHNEVAKAAARAMIADEIDVYKAKITELETRVEELTEKHGTITSSFQNALATLDVKSKELTDLSAKLKAKKKKAEEEVVPKADAALESALQLFITGALKAMAQYEPGHPDLTYPGFKELKEALKLSQ